MFSTRFRIIQRPISMINNGSKGPISYNKHVKFSTVKPTNCIRNILWEKTGIWTKKCRFLHDDIFDITKNPSSENFDKEVDSENELEEFENSLISMNSGLEEEIAEFFSERAIPYEEIDAVEGYFSAQCPVCSKKNDDKAIFVETYSGYSFCPWCKFYGNWEDLVAKYDLEDYLSQSDLDNLLDSSNVITEKQKRLLRLTPFAELDAKKLQQVEARITDDECHLLFPLKNEENNLVGFASFSLLHPKKSFKATYQLLRGSTGIFNCKSMEKNKGKLIICSKIVDCVALIKANKRTICFTKVPSMHCLEWALKDEKQLHLWIEEQLNENLVTYLKMQKHAECYLISKHEHRQKLIKRSPRSIGTACAEAIRVFDADVVKDFESIQSEVFDIIRKKDELAGTKWLRYDVLNEILHGHRAGELTIFTGLTGTGKTTFMSEYSLDLCMQGVPTLWGSFEVDHIRLIENMLQQFAGSPVPNHVFAYRNLAKEFKKLPMYTLNYYGQQDLQSVLNPMCESVASKGVRHIIIDNLQFMLGVNNKAADWWVDQDRAVGAFRNFATKYNCHVTLIVHPKKLQNGEIFGLNNISGGARVTQEADNVMILQTKMKANTPDTFAPKTLQIVKNRYGGTLGEVKLSFHKESKTFSSFFSTSKTPKVPNNSPYAKVPSKQT